MSCGCGGTNRSDEGLNLSGSWQQGHSATYNTLSRSYVVCKGFYPSLGGNYVTRRPPRLIRHEGLANDTCLWGPEGPYCWSAIERWAHASLLARRSEEHTSELQSPKDLVCRLLLEKK